MSNLLQRIRDATAEDRFLASWHADERCEERKVTTWQLVDGLRDGDLIEERPNDTPNPTVVMRQVLANGETVEVVWAWLRESRRALIVTVYFPEQR